jgi:hypothetical protein
VACGPLVQAMATADFAVDPTDPHIARLKKPRDIMAAVAKVRKAGAIAGKSAGEDANGSASGANLDSGLTSLVTRLKQKRDKQ